MREEKIIVKDLFSSAITKNNALLLREHVIQLLDKDRIVILDFSGVTKYTILFFNFSTGYFVFKLEGEEEYNKRIKLEGLTKLGRSFYKSSYNNAVKKFEGEQKWD